MVTERIEGARKSEIFGTPRQSLDWNPGTKQGEVTMADVIRIRPHHLLAIEDHLYRFGLTVDQLHDSAYSNEFVSNEIKIMRKIIKKQGCMVEIVPSIDDLCICKPKRARCFDNDPLKYISYLLALNIEVGGMYSGNELVEKIRELNENGRRLADLRWQLNKEY